MRRDARISSALFKVLSLAAFIVIPNNCSSKGKVSVFQRLKQSRPRSLFCHLTDSSLMGRRLGKFWSCNSNMCANIPFADDRSLGNDTQHPHNYLLKVLWFYSRLRGGSRRRVVVSDSPMCICSGWHIGPVASSFFSMVF